MDICRSDMKSKHMTGELWYSIHLHTKKFLPKMLTLTNLITCNFSLFVTCKMLHSVDSGKDEI